MRYFGRTSCRRSSTWWVGMGFGLGMLQLGCGWQTDQTVTQVSAAYAYSVCFSPNGALLATGHDSAVRTWNVSPCGAAAEYKGTKGTGFLLSPVRTLAFLPDGRTVLAPLDYGTSVVLWDSATGQASTWLRAHADPVRSVALSPDGQVVALLRRGGTAEIRSLDKGELKASLALDRSREFALGASAAMAFSSDGSRLALVAGATFVTIWEWGSDKPPWRLLGHTDLIRCAAFSTDGARLATAGNDGNVHTWDLASRRLLRTFSDRHLMSRIFPQAAAVAFAPDGRHLVSAHHVLQLFSRDTSRVILWEADSGRIIAQRTDSGFVRALVFSPDGLAVASVGDYLSLWDVSAAVALDMDVPAALDAAMQE